jgi:hypothetical protein
MGCNVSSEPPPESLPTVETEPATEPATTTTTEPTTATTVSTPSLGLSTFESNILKLHNDAREKAGLQPLQYDKALAQKAQDWAEFLKSQEQCTLRHPINTQEEIDMYIPGNMGQNLYVGHGYPVSPANAEAAVTGWYNECKDYSPPAPTEQIPKNFDAVGHFTQLMWKDSKKLGCAIVDCPKQMTDSNNNVVEAKGNIIACNYDKGNIGGQFGTMVPYPVGCPLKL